MKAFILTALTGTGKPAKSAKSVVSYKDPTRALSAVILADKLQLTTHHDSHNMIKHLHLNQWETTVTVGSKTYKLRAKVSPDELTMTFWYW
jgi:hypothetical protein